MEKNIFDFLSLLARDSNISPENIQHYQVQLTELWQLVQRPTLDEKEIMLFLEERNNFLIDSFICFVRKSKLNKPLWNRLNLVKKVMWEKTIEARDYVERIQLQGLQFQIDNYYLPKTKPQRRRVDIILKFLSPGTGERILDLGCGVGTFAYHSAKTGGSMLGN